MSAYVYSGGNVRKVDTNRLSTMRTKYAGPPASPLGQKKYYAALLKSLKKKEKK